MKSKEREASAELLTQVSFARSVAEKKNRETTEEEEDESDVGFSL